MGVAKRKRKKNPWQAEVYEDGIVVASQCFPTQGAAWSWHDGFKKRRRSTGGRTLAEVIEEYRREEFPNLVTSTRRSADIRLKLVKASPLARLTMDELNSRAVDDFLAWAMKQPAAKNPQRSSFKHELKALGVISAYYRDYHDEHFVSPITRRHAKKARIRTVQPRRPDYFLPATHIKLWLAELRNERDPAYFRCAVFQLVMGVRVSEAAALQRDAIDLDRNVLEIKRTMEWKSADGKSTRHPANRTKTPSSRRTLPLPGPGMVRDILMETFAAHPDSTLVFRNRNGRPLAYNAIHDAYNRAFARAKLPWTATHITRFTNATHGLKAGGKAAVQVNLGHASDRETEAYANVVAITENPVPGLIARLIEDASRTESRTLAGAAENSL